jgi:hypothetical protein
MFVYVIDRDGEIDVYASIYDAEEASAIVGRPYVEQVVFPPSSTDDAREPWQRTRSWLDELGAEKGPD